MDGDRLTLTYDVVMLISSSIPVRDAYTVRVDSVPVTVNQVEIRGKAVDIDPHPGPLPEGEGDGAAEIWPS